MKKSFENYTVLTGNHGRRGSLWKGEDHLLAVEGRGVIFPYSEHYRRVDYKNIQAITHVLTKRYWIILFALLIPMLLLAGGAALALSTEKAPIAITLGVIFLPFLGMLTWHMALGKTCVCTLQTAVQNLRLKPLTRINKARQVMSEIQSLCLLHQGPMPTEFADAAFNLQPDYSAPGTKPLWQGSAWVMAAGIALVILGAGLILCGAVIASELWGTQYDVLYIDSFLCAVAFICSIAGLAKAMRHQTPEGLMPALWTSLGLEVIAGGAFYVLIMIDNMTRSRFRAGPVKDLRRLLSQSPFSPENTGWALIGLGCVFALPGLILMFYGFHRVAPHPKPSRSPSVPPAL